MIEPSIMYLPAFPGLSPRDYFPRRSRDGGLPFPIGAPGAVYGFVARNLIYHLFRALRSRGVDAVLVPDYHHGNEIRAIRAAGAELIFYPIRRDLKPDLDALDRSSRSKARALFVIHYLGWPQPMEEIGRLCRERGLVLFEDCALAFLSLRDGRPLGSFGDYAVFCLYKTLPVPDGAVLVQNGEALDALASLRQTPCSALSLAGRCLELNLQWTRRRAELPGRALAGMKRAGGRALRRLGARHQPVGDSGFDLGRADLGMSPVSRRLLESFDFAEVRRRRSRNFRLLREALAGRVAVPRMELTDGVCPLFFPVLVVDKGAAARALWRRGIGAVEFWNQGAPGCETTEGPDARFLRRHLLELPIHQDLEESQVRQMAEEVLRLGQGLLDRPARL